MKAAFQQVWPLPLPYPEIHKSKVDRRLDSVATKLGVNYIVVCMNFLRGQGQHWKKTMPGLGTPLNAKQWEAVRRIEHHVRTWNAEAPTTADDMGRAASKVQSVEELMASIEKDAVRSLGSQTAGYRGRRKMKTEAVRFEEDFQSLEVGVCNHVPAHLAKAVEARRFKFWKTPSFDASPFLDYKMRSLYNFPLDHAEKDEDAVKPPRVSVRCSAQERLRLLETLDQTGRLQLVTEAEVRMKFRNGMFSIPKDQSKDRMVLDARPPNLLEDPACDWIGSLGSVAQLNHLFIKPEEELRMFAEDLREFYHAFVISAQRVRRNALACEVRPEQVSHLECFQQKHWKEERLIPCLNTMAMGDCHAVSFGQVSHLAVLLRTGAVSLDDFLMLRARPSRKTWVAGLMIDDLVLLERRVRSEDGAVDHGDRPPSTCEKIIEKVRAQYEEVKLPRHDGKAIYNSLEGTFWGVQLDGERGEIRPNLKRSIPFHPSSDSGSWSRDRGPVGDCGGFSGGDLPAEEEIHGLPGGGVHISEE